MVDGLVSWLLEGRSSFWVCTVNRKIASVLMSIVGYIHNCMGIAVTKYRVCLLVVFFCELEAVSGKLFEVYVLCNWCFRLGGPDPLDYISMYTNPGDPEQNIPPHWHYIRYSLSMFKLIMSVQCQNIQRLLFTDVVAIKCSF